MRCTPDELPWPTLMIFGAVLLPIQDALALASTSAVAIGKACQLCDDE